MRKPSRSRAIATLVGAVPIFFVVVAKLSWGSPITLRAFAAAVGRGRLAAPEPVSIRGVRVADARSWRDATLSDVRIRDGRIVVVVPSGGLTPEPGERLIDGAGRTVTPGLVDVRSEILFRDPLRRILPPEVARDSLRAQVRSGVTSLRDLGSPLAAVAPLRAALGARIVAPSAVLGGPWLALDAGPDRGVDPQASPAEEELVASTRDLQRAVEESSRSGVRWVAVRPPLDADRSGARGQLAELAALAGARGLDLAVRVVDEESLGWALAAGARSLEELAAYRGELSDSLVQRIAASGAVVVPLAHLTRVREIGSDGDFELDKQTRWIGRASWWGALADLDRGIRARHADPVARESARLRLETFRANLARLAAAGVPIALGTGSPAAFAFPERPDDEIAELANAGLTGPALATASTVAGRRLIARDADPVALVPGAPADLVVWDCDPIEDARCYQRPRWVVAGGRVLEGRPPQPARPFL